MEEGMAAQDAPIKVYENTYIMKPIEDPDKGIDQR